jgi:uncharacterized protein YigE (DUF2233 family)
MKTTAFIIVILIIGYIIIKSLPPTPAKPRQIPDQVKKISIQNTPTPTIQLNQVNLNGTKYSYGIIQVQHNQEVFLIANFLTASLSAEIKNVYACDSIVNGGFYDTANKPLGLFTVGNHTYSAQIPSALVNGFVWRNQTNNYFIGETAPISNFNWILQTGPFLVESGHPMVLKLTADENARRMVAATSGNNLYFLTLYNPDQIYSGPNLADVPTLVSQISRDNNLNIQNAINLDGGMASAFINPNLKLEELTRVGSFFCIK